MEMLDLDNNGLQHEHVMHVVGDLDLDSQIDIVEMSVDQQNKNLVISYSPGRATVRAAADCKDTRMVPFASRAWFTLVNISGPKPAVLAVADVNNDSAPDLVTLGIDLKSYGSGGGGVEAAHVEVKVVSTAVCAIRVFTTLPHHTRYKHSIEMTGPGNLRAALFTLRLVALLHGIHLTPAYLEESWATARYAIT